jgi:hypothetical protein
MDPLTIGTTLLSAGSAFMQGKAEAKAAKAQAREKELSAREVLARAEINKRARTSQGQKQRAEVGNTVASNGFAPDASLPMLEASLADEIEANLNTQREASFQAASLRREGSSLESSAKYKELSGIVSAIPSLLSGGKGLYDTYNTESANSSLIDLLSPKKTGASSAGYRNPLRFKE